MWMCIIFIGLNTCLDTQLGPSPVSSLCVVSDRVIGLHTDPLGKRAVLTLLLGELELGAESFVGGHGY